MDSDKKEKESERSISSTGDLDTSALSVRETEPKKKRVRK